MDDEDDFRHTLAKRLAKRGFAVEQAADGRQGLAMLAAGDVDVVVLDVKMPGMTGIEVLQEIKARYAQVEVILLTGHATTASGVEGIKSGAFDYLTKPIELDHLVAKITQAREKSLRLETERKEAEYRKKMEQQMITTERLASLGTLATGVAHEINNPLAIISESAGWMKQLLDREELKGMHRRQDFLLALDKVENSVERAKRITHQLLGFVRKSDSSFTKVNLAGLIDEALQLIEHETKTRDIKIIRKITSPETTVWSDPYRIRQALINLLTNAVHALGSEGVITLALEDSVDQFALTVSDNGPGIPRENLAKIFEPFFSTKSPGQGTGLGLFVTRGIIEKMGGTVTVESDVGKGATFCIRLPKQMKKVDEFIGEGAENWIEKVSSQLRNADDKEKKSP
ncbi:MAG: response regulator [Desulfobacterales bacterium]|nr:MAG: response regulator [Desulfobacterales bacterium]